MTEATDDENLSVTPKRVTKKKKLEDYVSSFDSDSESGSYQNLTLLFCRCLYVSNNYKNRYVL